MKALKQDQSQNFDETESNQEGSHPFDEFEKKDSTDNSRPLTVMMGVREKIPN